MIMDLNKTSIEDLRDLISLYSNTYKQSKTIRNAFRYIESVDESVAKRLLYDFACEMWDEEDVEEYFSKIDNTINIDGVDYKILYSDFISPFDIMSYLHCGEAARYFDKYMYRTKDGQARVCYADDTSNNWDV